MTPLSSHHPRLSSSGSTDSLISAGSSQDGLSSSASSTTSRRHRFRIPRLDDGRPARRSSGARRSADLNGDDGEVDEEAEGLTTGRGRKAAPAASPLVTMGLVKGDGLMLFITCFASLGVFLFGYDQGVMVSRERARRREEG